MTPSLPSITSRVCSRVCHFKSATFETCEDMDVRHAQTVYKDDDVLLPVDKRTIPGMLKTIVSLAFS